MEQMHRKTKQRKRRKLVFCIIIRTITLISIPTVIVMIMTTIIPMNITIIMLVIMVIHMIIHMIIHIAIHTIISMIIHMITARTTPTDKQLKRCPPQRPWNACNRVSPH